MYKKSIIYILIAIIILITACIFFSDIVFYIISSVILAFVLRPLVNFLDSFRIGKVSTPRWLIILVSYGFLLFSIYFFISLFIPLFREQQEKIQTIDSTEVNHFLIEVLGKIENILKNNGIIDTKKNNFLFNKLIETKNTFIQTISPSSVVNKVISFTGNILTTLLAVFFISFFMLLEKGKVTRLILSVVANPYFELSLKAIYKIKNLLSNYLIGLLVQMLCICTFTYIGLSIFDVNYALTISIFAAFINLVPYVGPLLGIAFGVIVGLTTVDFTSIKAMQTLFLEIISVFLIVQLNDNIILQPLIFSKSVKAHPVEIFIAIFAGATLGGAIGMILAIPTYTILRVTLMELLHGYKQYNVFRLNFSKNES